MTRIFIRGRLLAGLIVAILSATYCSDTAEPVPGVESISLSADSIAIQFRDSTAELTAAPKGALGVELDAEVTWQSKNTNVVSIVPNGKTVRLIPVRPGAAEVEAASDNVVARAKVVVLDTVFSVQVNGTDTLVTMGRSLTFTSVVQGPAAASRGVTWRVADEVVARIDSVTEGTNRVYVSSRDTGRTEVIATSAVDRIKTARIPFRTARPVSLAFESEPGHTTSPIRADDILIPGPTVIARDILGNEFPAPVTVTLAITSGTGKAGAALFGTPVVTSSSGSAQFENIGVDSAGTGYRLTATAPGLTSATSSLFDVGPKCVGVPYTLNTTVTGTLTSSSCQSRVDEYYAQHDVTSSTQQFLTVRIPQPFRIGIVYPDGTRRDAESDSLIVVVPPGSFSIRVRSGPTTLLGDYRMSTGSPSIARVPVVGQGVACYLIQLVPGIVFVDELRCGNPGSTLYRLHLKANATAAVSINSPSFEPSLSASATINGTPIASDPPVPGRFTAHIVVPAEPVARNVIISVGAPAGPPLGTPFTITIQPR